LFKNVCSKHLFVASREETSVDNNTNWYWLTISIKNQTE